MQFAMMVIGGVVLFALLVKFLGRAMYASGKSEAVADAHKEIVEDVEQVNRIKNAYGTNPEFRKRVRDKSTRQ